MAANFWTSSHARLLVPKEQLSQLHGKDCLRGLSQDQIHQLKSYFVSYIFDLARHCKLRQRVACTASVYFRRFYLKNNLCDHRPQQVAPACLYVASKAEEMVVPAKHLVHHAQRQYPQLSKDFEVRTLLDMEMVVLEELEFDLIIFSPFRSLTELIKDSGEESLAHPAWAILNDSFRTDVMLVWPPYMVALSALHIASLHNGVDLVPWLKKLDVDLDQVFDIAMDIMYMYEVARESPVKSQADALAILDRLQSE